MTRLECECRCQILMTLLKLLICFLAVMCGGTEVKQEVSVMALVIKV